MGVSHINLLSKLRIYDYIIRRYNYRIQPFSSAAFKSPISHQQFISHNEWLYNKETWSVRRKHLCYDRLFHTAVSCLSTDGDRQALKPSVITEADYEMYVEETLDSLTEFFEDLPEKGSCNKDYDCTYGNGVLTIYIGGAEGTYVINKQSPNKQIWLSSPVSGPKRYDFFNGQWVYLRDGKGLHRLLEEEISELMRLKIDLKKCKYYSHRTPDK
uniref:ferroxidase n=1 Tax=Arion vulgaris TaxID=1028688 RepID=A0A0B7B3G9_9EUPU